MAGPNPEFPPFHGGEDFSIEPPQSQMDLLRSLRDNARRRILQARAAARKAASLARLLTKVQQQSREIGAFGPMAFPNLDPKIRASLQAEARQLAGRSNTAAVRARLEQITNIIGRQPNYGPVGRLTTEAAAEAAANARPLPPAEALRRARISLNAFPLGTRPLFHVATPLHIEQVAAERRALVGQIEARADLPARAANRLPLAGPALPPRIPLQLPTEAFGPPRPPNLRPAQEVFQVFPNTSVAETNAAIDRGARIVLGPANQAVPAAIRTIQGARAIAGSVSNAAVSAARLGGRAALAGGGAALRIGGGVLRAGNAFGAAQTAMQIFQMQADRAEMVSLIGEDAVRRQEVLAAIRHGIGTPNVGFGPNRQAMTREAYERANQRFAEDEGGADEAITAWFNARFFTGKPTPPPAGLNIARTVDVDNPLAAARGLISEAERVRLERIERFLQER